MGSGFLALPHAFYEAGLLLSACVLLLVVCTMHFTSLLEVEVMSRAEAVAKADAAPASNSPATRKQLPPNLTAMWDSPVVNSMRQKAQVAAASNGGKSGHKQQQQQQKSQALPVSSGKNVSSSSGGGSGSSGSVTLRIPNGVHVPTPMTLSPVQMRAEEADVPSPASARRARDPTGEGVTLLTLAERAESGGVGSGLAGAPSPVKALPAQPAYGLSQHAYQMTELCEIFGAERLKMAYDVTIALYMFCTLWGYAAVFGTALSAHLTPPFLGLYAGYVAYVLGFACVVVPLATMEVKEQVAFQVFMTFMRFAVVVSMLATVASALIWPDSSLFDSFESATDVAAPLVRWQGIFEVLPVVMFASMLNSSVSIVVQAIDDKSAIRAVITAGMAFTFLTYGSLGIFIAYYFGSGVDNSCNVNWVEVVGNRNDWAGTVLSIVGLFVLLFPALDVLSVYPLNVMVLSNNMMAAAYHDRVDKAERDRVIVTTFRVACALPPILCALAFPDLTQIVSYAGSLAIVISMIVPPLLAMRSRKICNDRFGVAQTPYESRFSRPAVLKTIVGFGAVFLGAIFVKDVWAAASGN